MSNAVFTSQLPQDRLLYVGEFNEAWRSKKDDGINFKGAVITDESGAEHARGNLFLFDSVIRDRQRNMQAITQIFTLAARHDEGSGKTYWNYAPVDLNADGTQVPVVDVKGATAGPPQAAQAPISPAPTQPPPAPIAVPPPLSQAFAQPGFSGKPTMAQSDTLHERAFAEALSMVHRSERELLACAAGLDGVTLTVDLNALTYQRMRLWQDSSDFDPEPPDLAF